MKNAIILHGKPGKEEYYGATIPSPSNAHWLPWLQQQLIIKDILAQTPEMPRPYEPVYADWKQMFEQFNPNDQTRLVGHSCGGGFLVRWLSENNVKVGKVVLVAPSLGIDWDDRGFFDFKLNPSIVSQTQGITIIVAKDDRPGILDAVQRLKTEVQNIKLIELPSGGHLTYKHMQSLKFHELLDEVLT